MESIRLKYIAKIDMGQSPSSSDYTTENDEDGIPFLQGTAEFGKKYPTPVVYTTQANKIADEGDILFSVRAPVGQININKDKVGIGRGLCAIKANNKTSQDYLWWVLHASRGQLKLLETGTTYAAVSVEDISNMIVPLHEKSKQNKIVAYLDQEVAKIDALIEKKTRLVELLEEKKKATISQAVTKGLNPNVKLKPSGIDWLGDIPEHWEVKKLKYVLKSLNSIRIPLSAEERGLMSDKTYDYYGASGVIDKVEDYLFAEPLILVGEDGANLLSRNSRLVFIAEGKYWVNNHAHILKPLYGNMIYYCEMMETLDFSLWVSGSAQPKLTSENLMNIEIIVPPNNEQDSISIYLQELNNKFDIMFEKINNSIDLLKEKRTAIISAAINGEINL